MSDKDELKSARVIFLIGGPGSGKATQSERLVSTYGLTHLSTGDLLRTEVAFGSDSAYRIRKTMLNRELVPVADVIRLLGNAMRARLLDSPGFLVDGCPRDREQAMSFELMLVPCRVAVFLDVPEDVMLQRLLRRGRRNDKEEIIRKKIKTFKDKTLAVVKYFEKQGKLVRVDGTGTASEVFSRVRDGLISFRPKTTGKQPAARGKMTSRVMAFKTAVARPSPDKKSAQKSARKRDSLSSESSDSAKTKRRRGVKTGSTGSSSSASKQRRKHQDKPDQKHKSHHQQKQQKAEKHRKDAAKEQSPKTQDKKQQKADKHKKDAAKEQSPKTQDKKQQQKTHHQAKKQLPEQHHRAKKQLPEQHHRAKKQLPEQHHQPKKQREQTPEEQKSQKSPQSKRGHHK